MNPNNPALTDAVTALFVGSTPKDNAKFRRRIAGTTKMISSGHSPASG